MQGWRLGIKAQDLGALGPVLPRHKRYGTVIDRIGLVPALLAFLLVSASVVYAGNKMPQWLAPHIPEAWEQQYGAALVGDLGGKYCAGAGGQAALDTLTAKLAPEADKLKVRVVPVKMVNAAALPGGTIVIFNELLAEADGPEEVSGILAHEIAHVERRHVTQAMIRDLGLGLVVSAFGGQTGGSIDGLLSAGYSRGSESQADSDAIAKLRSAGIDPRPTAKFFKKLADQEAKFGQVARGLSYVSTHPMSGDRQRAFAASAEKGRKYKPALTRDEWEALFNICHNDPNRRGKSEGLFPFG
jgi:Zn-dependent protease with chaperone function